MKPAASIRAGVLGTFWGVIDAGARHLRRRALAQRLYGLRFCKVKVGHAGDDDATRLRMIRRWIGPRVDLRIDVNGVWRAAELRDKLEPLLASHISCVEQPVAHEELAHLPSCAAGSVCRSCSTNRSPARSTVVGDRAGRLRFVQYPLVEVRRLLGEPAVGGNGSRGRARLSTGLPSG